MKKFQDKYGMIEGVSAYKKDYSRDNIIIKMKQIAESEKHIITEEEIISFLEEEHLNEKE